jgi:hypothetical protein
VASTHAKLSPVSTLMMSNGFFTEHTSMEFETVSSDAG